MLLTLLLVIVYKIIVPHFIDLIVHYESTNKLLLMNYVSYNERHNEWWAPSIVFFYLQIGIFRSNK